jgi:hypothetical protein
VCCEALNLFDSKHLVGGSLVAIQQQVRMSGMAAPGPASVCPRRHRGNYLYSKMYINKEKNSSLCFKDEC